MDTTWGAQRQNYPTHIAGMGEEVHAGKHSNSVITWVHSVVKIQMSREIIIFNLLEFFFKVSKKEKRF